MTATAREAVAPLDASTRLAVDRTRLAYERTLMAWVRTATSMISFGFTIYKFFELDLRGRAGGNQLIGPREFALVLIVIGLVTLMLAGGHHQQNLKVLREQYGVAVARSTAARIAVLIGVLGVIALAGVLLRA
jgi:putative membrane protein